MRVEFFRNIDQEALNRILKTLDVVNVQCLSCSNATNSPTTFNVFIVIREVL